MVTIRAGGKFDPMVRGTNRPPNTVEKLLGFGCGLINLVLQHYILYGGGGEAFCDAIGYKNAIEISDTQKMLMMILFVENQLQIDLRNFFILQSAVFSSWSIAFTHLFVRPFMYTMLSLTAYMGYGLLPGYVYVLSIGYMALFQYIECKGDYDLAEFVKRKRAGLTTAKVCTEKSWSVTRHPNHLGFIHWWLPHTLMATSNPWTVLYVFSFLHFWILCLGIPSNEQYMLEAYGDEYATYQSKVPMLYPKLIKTEEDGKNGLFPTEFTALLHDAH